MEEDILNLKCSKSPKMYKQKFRESWISGEFRDWLTRSPINPDFPFCKICLRKIEGGLSHLKRHASSSFHKRNQLNYENSIACENEGSQQFNNQKSQKSVKNKFKKPKSSTSDISNGVSSFNSGALQTLPLSKQFIEVKFEGDKLQEVADVPHIESEQSRPTEVVDLQTEVNLKTGLKTSMHQSSFLESTISLPNVVASHVAPGFENTHCSDAQQWQAVHIPHDLQVAIREEDKNTAHAELFTTNFTDAHKLADEAYLVELNNVGSSCEVTVGSHHADCSSIHNLETDHHAGHITVTIQGQDPMYIHSTVNPDTSISYSHTNTEMECSSHGPHSSKKEKIISSSKRKRRLMKPKKSCRPGAQSGIERNSGGGTASSLKMEATSPNCDDAKYNPDEDGKDPRRSCRWYRQKYKKNWEKSKEFVGWLSPAPGDPSMAYCIACAKCLRGGMTHLKRHAETPYHKKRMIETLKMREIVLAKTVELRLSKFAHEFGLTDAAVAALPDLLKSIFPDNSLCKLLSDDRILTMLLVRKEESQSAAPSKLVSRKKSSQIVHSKPCKVNSHTSSETDAPAVIRFPCPEPEHCSHESSSGSQYNMQGYGDLDPMHTKYMPLEQHHQISLHPHPGSQAHSGPATVASSIISSNFSNCAMETRLEAHQDVMQPCPEGAVSERYSVGAMDDTRPVMAEAGQARVPLPRVLVHHASNDTLTVRSYSFSPYHVYPSLFSTAGMERWQGKVAIVTGASAGIGAAICRSLVALGMRVVGVARAHHRILELAKELEGERGTLTALQCDVSKDEEVEEVFKQVLSTHGAVHCCINNAGISCNNSLLDGSPQEWRQMLDVNVVGLCLFTKLAVNSMKEAGIDDGHIIHISSLSGHRVPPNSPTHFYCATKHAVKALTEGLRHELRAAKSHIRISSISPGLVQTEFMQNMTGDSAYADKLYSSIDCIKAEDVAASVVHVLVAPPHVEINDILMRPTEQTS